jgi:hypothetical protein
LFVFGDHRTPHGDITGPPKGDITGPPTVISLFDGGGGNSDITFGGSGDITFATTPKIFKKK